jgi:endonuclease-3 related protein
MKLHEVYSTLLKSFGRQNWWPMEKGFDPPEWEVCVGAVLTQNTSWANAEKALENLRKAGKTGVLDLPGTGQRELEKLVRPSGFYRQKALRLKGLADFVMGFGGFRGFAEKAEREGLLGVRGIGPETADSILLYALGRPYFVVDAYTRRVFRRLGILAGDEDYEEIRNFFESGLKKDPEIYREFHALVVELAKRHCKKNPECLGCPLGKKCRKV